MIKKLINEQDLNIRKQFFRESKCRNLISCMHHIQCHVKKKNRRTIFKM